MTTITINRKDLRPFETVAGRVSWSLDKEPRGLELRLFWFTRGYGSEESKTLASLPLGDAARGERDFSFELPDQPWSVKGRMVTIIWALEVVAEKSGGLALEEIVVAPERRVIELPEVADSKFGGAAARWAKRMKRNGSMSR